MAQGSRCYTSNFHLCTIDTGIVPPWQQGPHCVVKYICVKCHSQEMTAYFMLASFASRLPVSCYLRGPLGTRLLRRVVLNLPAIVPEPVRQVCLAVGPAVIMQNDNVLAWQSTFMAMYGLSSYLKCTTLMLSSYNVTSQANPQEICISSLQNSFHDIPGCVALTRYAWGLLHHG